MADRSSKGKSKSAKYYQNNPEAREKKKKYDTKYHGTPERKEYRRKLMAKNREEGNRVGDGQDVSHTRGGGTSSEAKSKNRARQGAGGKAKKK